MSAFMTLTAANIRSFVRDRTALFWTFAFPVIFILLFGAIFSGGGTPSYNVGWVDQDGTAASALLRNGFAGVPLLKLKDGSLSASLDAMRKGSLNGVVVVPKGYGAAIAAARGSSAAGAGTRAAATAGPIAAGPGTVPLDVYTDPSQQTSSATIRQVVAQVVSTTNLALLGGRPILATVDRSLQTQDLSNAAFLVPGILGMALMQLGVFGAVPLVAQREKLILKRLGATPLPRWTLVGSNVVLRLLIGIGQAVLILGIGVAVFGVTVLGALWLMVAIVVLGALTFISIGYVVASFARTEDAANGIVQVIQFPMMFLSGVFFPIEIMPSLLRPVAAVLPLTYLGDALRQVMVGGSPYAPLPLDLGILTAWFVVCLAISARFFRWE
jgi:ABC-2 type transport system permease protein